MFELILQVRDNFGKSTGRTRYCKSETGVAIHDFWVKNTPQIRRERKKKKTNLKNSPNSKNSKGSPKENKRG